VGGHYNSVGYLNLSFTNPNFTILHTHTESSEQIATEFDPSAGQHTEDDSEDLRELDYEAPYRFIITDSLPKEVRENGSLVVEKDDVSICYLPFWLFLLIC